MTNGQIWFGLVVITILIAGWALGYAKHNQVEQDHRRNIECIQQGGKFEYAHEDYTTLICKK